jgi:hypothetical protein
LISKKYKFCVKKNKENTNLKEKKKKHFDEYYIIQ